MNLKQQAERRGNAPSREEDNPADNCEQPRNDFLLHEHVCGDKDADKSDDVVQAVSNELVNKHIVDRIQDVGSIRCDEGDCTRSDKGNQCGENCGSFVHRHCHLFQFLSYC